MARPRIDDEQLLDALFYIGGAADNIRIILVRQRALRAGDEQSILEAEQARAQLLQAQHRITKVLRLAQDRARKQKRRNHERP